MDTAITENLRVCAVAYMYCRYVIFALQIAIIEIRFHRPLLRDAKDCSNNNFPDMPSYTSTHKPINYYIFITLLHYNVRLRFIVRVVRLRTSSLMIIIIKIIQMYHDL